MSELKMLPMVLAMAALCGALLAWPGQGPQAAELRQATEDQAQEAPAQEAQRVGLMTLAKQQGKLHLKLGQKALGLQVFSGGKLLDTLGPGDDYDVTKYLAGAKGGRLTFVARLDKGRRHSQDFSIRPYLSLASQGKAQVSTLKKGLTTHLDKATAQAGPTGQATGKGKSKNLFEVQRAYIKDHKLRLTLAYKGPRVRSRQYGGLMLRIRTSGQALVKPLSELDPKWIDSSWLPKTMELATGLKAQAGQWVTVELALGTWRDQAQLRAMAEPQPRGLDPGRLTVIKPGLGGEHYWNGGGFTIIWRFRPGSSGEMPTQWRITLLHYDPAGSTREAASFVAREDGTVAMPTYSITRRDGEWEYSYWWLVPSNFPCGYYRIKVSGGRWSDEGTMAFGIGDHWNLQPVYMEVDDQCHLVVSVSNAPSHMDMAGQVYAGGAIDLRVELLDPAVYPNYLRVLQTWNVQSSLRGENMERLDLGRLLSRVNACDMASDCRIPLRVTVDTTDRITEYTMHPDGAGSSTVAPYSQENDNVLHQLVCCPPCGSGWRCP